MASPELLPQPESQANGSESHPGVLRMGSTLASPQPATMNEAGWGWAGIGVLLLMSLLLRVTLVLLGPADMPSRTLDHPLSQAYIQAAQPVDAQSQLSIAYIPAAEATGPTPTLSSTTSEPTPESWAPPLRWGYEGLLTRYAALDLPWLGLIAVQHLLALAAAMCVFLIARGLVNRTGVALLAAAVVGLHPWSLTAPSLILPGVWGAALITGGLAILLARRDGAAPIPAASEDEESPLIEGTARWRAALGGAMIGASSAFIPLAWMAVVLVALGCWIRQPKRGSPSAIGVALIVMMTGLAGPLLVNTQANGSDRWWAEREHIEHRLLHTVPAWHTGQQPDHPKAQAVADGLRHTLDSLGHQYPAVPPVTFSREQLSAAMTGQPLSYLKAELDLLPRKLLDHHLESTAALMGLDAPPPGPIAGTLRQSSYQTAIGPGQALSGGWIAMQVALLMAAGIGLALALARRQYGPALLVLGLLGICAGALWSFDPSAGLAWLASIALAIPLTALPERPRMAKVAKLDQERETPAITEYVTEAVGVVNRESQPKPGLREAGAVIPPSGGAIRPKSTAIQPKPTPKDQGLEVDESAAAPAAASSPQSIRPKPEPIIHTPKSDETSDLGPAKIAPIEPKKPKAETPISHPSPPIQPIPADSSQAVKPDGESRSIKPIAPTQASPPKIETKTTSPDPITPMKSVAAKQADSDQTSIKPIAPIKRNTSTTSQDSQVQAEEPRDNPDTTAPIQPIQPIKPSKTRSKAS